MKPILESVINISTAHIPFVNHCITTINEMEDVAVLDVHRGDSVNRTVITICGTPKALFSALVWMFQETTTHVDMREQRGVHPRIGAVDVCPIIPIRGVSEQECHSFVLRLSEHVGNHLQVPIYLYERSATSPKRQFLYNIRRGEYEGLSKKLLLPDWKPDYGPTTWTDSVAKTGASAIGVRPLMVAWNLSLHTHAHENALRIAQEIRGTGSLRNGTRIHGLFASVRAIAWDIPELHCTQISLNIYNVNQDKMIDIFDVVQEKSNQGIRETERIGLIPLCALGLTDSAGVEEVNKIVKRLKILHIDPKHHILEYAIQEKCDRANFMEDYPCLDFSP